MKHLFALASLLMSLIYQPLFAQAPPAGFSVSLLTCSPGDDLYSVFGHSAIHVYDSQSGIDKVYNYGTFDFDTPNFYVKFARGQLNYSLAVSDLGRFLGQYKYEGRWVKRQELNLTEEEKRAVFAFLENNAKPENRDYKYDFFYDNCSSRIRDVFETVLGNRLTYPAAARDTSATFRQMIKLYLGNHPWSELGIDLALGIPCDYQADYRDKMFLPDYLMAGFDDARVMRDGESVPLVESTALVLPENPALRDTGESSITWAFWVFFGVCLLTGIFVDPARMRWFDISLFAFVGLLSIVILLLWFATDHSATKWNMNILWALPTWFYGAYLIAVHKPESRFFRYQSGFLFFVVVAWMWIPQTLNAAIIPVVLALITRGWSWQKMIFSNQQSQDAAKT
ncbi:MAG: DUF4105 domain-containing protein [Cryomorphaceae bacterium]|nr:DUF4105 domain-containing protein [Flavobacteriales bacterium]